MKIEKSKITKLKISGIKHLDLINVFLDDFGNGQGRIMIECYGKAWTSYWSAMGENTISKFFCSCNNDYLINNLAPNLEPEIYDINQIKDDAEKKGLGCWRDDPWNDYEFLSKMYGNDMVDWSDKLPKEDNPKFTYLCRIINTVKEALGTHLIKEK